MYHILFLKLVKIVLFHSSNYHQFNSLFSSNYHSYILIFYLLASTFSSTVSSTLFTNSIGFPAQYVYAGTLLPAGTNEFGPITHPLSSWAPSIITLLWPMCTSSSTKQESKWQFCSIVTSFPILMDKGNAWSGAQCVVSNTVFYPIFVLQPTLTADEWPLATLPNAK